MIMKILGSNQLAESHKAPNTSIFRISGASRHRDYTEISVLDGRDRALIQEAWPHLPINLKQAIGAIVSPY